MSNSGGGGGGGGGGGFMRRVQNFFGGQQQSRGNNNNSGFFGGRQQSRGNNNNNNNAGNARGSAAGRGVGSGVPMNIDLDTLLQSVFGGLQDFEAAATQAAVEASMREQQQHPRGAPPASSDTIRNLPLVRIKGEDLVDPVNRECCICLEEHKLSGTAVRLPCAHIFHKECVLNWLHSHCTCPVCRYELPTDDADFERQRVQRMRTRKPRYARHELERLSVRELKQLLPARDSYHAVDRSDLIEHVIKSGAIDLIASPEPVEYSLSALRQMSISQLKRCMNDEAGVFFDPKDVVEKEDMIRIFLASGRLCILPEDDEQENDSGENDAKPHAVQTVEMVRDDMVEEPPIVETVAGSEPTAGRDLRQDTTLVMEESDDHTMYGPDRDGNENAGAPFAQDDFLPVDQFSARSRANADVTFRALHPDGGCECTTAAAAATTENGEPRDVQLMSGEAVVFADGGARGGAGSASHSSAAADEDLIEKQPSYAVSGNHSGEDLCQPEDEAMEDTVGSHGPDACAESTDADQPMIEEQPKDATRGDDSVPTRGSTPDIASEDASADQSQTAAASPISAGICEQVRTTSSSSSYSSGSSLCDDPSRLSRKRSFPVDEESKIVRELSDDSAVARFGKLSVSELRQMGEEMSIDLSGCIERQEMVDRLSEHGSNSSGHGPATSLPLDGLSVSELLMVASMVGVSLSNGDREELVRILETEAGERPHVSSFVKALLPFVRLTVPQLRSLARERGVDVRGCLEKTDILRRLVHPA